MSNELVTRLLDECAQIPDEMLQSEVRDIIKAAEENADEYVEENAHEDEDDDHDDHGWEDAFMGTIENRCTDARAAVGKWFK